MVLRGALSFNRPTLENGRAFYLEYDAVEDGSASALLAMPMAALPGGGLRDGIVAEVTDDSQDLGEHACV